MVNTSVRCLPVDVLQDINSWHVFPLGQVKLAAGLKMFLWEYVVLDYEHSDLWNRTKMKYYHKVQIPVIQLSALKKMLGLDDYG